MNAKHLQREIETLKKQILSLGATVEESVRNAVQALDERDTKLASSVIARDSDIDHTEVDVEEECLKILALHQPVAIDLRFIIATLKINNDSNASAIWPSTSPNVQYISRHSQNLRFI